MTPLKFFKFLTQFLSFLRLAMVSADTVTEFFPLLVGQGL